MEGWTESQVASGSKSHLCLKLILLHKKVQWGILLPDRIPSRMSKMKRGKIGKTSVGVALLPHLLEWDATSVG